MADTRSKGTLKKWFDDKGFGFIQPADKSKDVFVHISSFPQGLPRRPKVGDAIFYHVTTDNKGKTKAIDTAIEGVTAPPPPARRTRPRPGTEKRRSKGNRRFLVLCTIVLLAAGSTLYKRVLQTGVNVLPSAKESTRFANSDSTGKQAVHFTCSGKTHCSEMTSCEEATFYIRNCPNTKMDGDGDGIPCERQFCN